MFGKCILVISPHLYHAFRNNIVITFSRDILCLQIAMLCQSSNICGF